LLRTRDGEHSGSDHDDKIILLVIRSMFFAITLNDSALINPFNLKPGIVVLIDRLH
jgi:hypothetical protein